MGTLGDHIGNEGDPEPVTRLMRTAPLWGLRFRTLLLHDGSASDVATAIARHDGGPQGQGTAAATAFAQLSAADQAALLQFLGTLRARPIRSGATKSAFAARFRAFCLGG